MIFVVHAQRIDMAEVAELLRSHDALQCDHQNALRDDRALHHDCAALKANLARALKHIDLSQPQLFGRRSERRIVDDGTYQINFGADFDNVPEKAAPETHTVDE